jgi:hypothetical protein
MQGRVRSAHPTVIRKSFATPPQIVIKASNALKTLDDSLRHALLSGMRRDDELYITSPSQVTPNASPRL